MQDQNKNALLFNHNISSRLLELCEPFFSLTGINSFAYVKFFCSDEMDSLSYLDIATKCDWLEFYFDQLDCTEFVREDIRKAPLNEFFFSMWNDVIDEDNLLKYEMLHHYNMWHGISLYYKTETACETWHFATDKNNTAINNFYMNSADFFNQFILFFQSKAKDIINPLDSKKLAVLNEKIDLGETASQLIDVAALKDSLGVDRIYIDDAKNCSLSSGEVKSLQLISMGKTAKEAARKLGISPRTVESTLNNIKVKTGLNTKSQLVDLFFNKCVPVVKMSPIVLK